MRVGYLSRARASTADQIAGFDARIQDIEAIGCTKMLQDIFHHWAMGTTGGSAGVRA